MREQHRLQAILRFVFPCEHRGDPGLVIGTSVRFAVDTGSVAVDGQRDCGNSRGVNKRLLLDDFLPYRLSIASNRVSDAVASTYRSLFGLRIPEWRLVTVIAETDGITQQALCVATRMDKVTVSRGAIALVDRGLVERRANDGDQRSHLLRLTPSGQALYEQVAPKALMIERELFASFTEQEVDMLRDMLARVQAAADAMEQHDVDQ